MFTEKEIRQNVGNIVKQLRIQKGLTQEKLAEFIDVQPQTIRAIEKGRSFLSCKVLTKLSNFFEVDYSFFFLKKANILNDDDNKSISKIKSLLPQFSSSKLNEIYNILLVKHK